MSERNKEQCIVLLPSGPHFERLFEEVLENAIRNTGLVPSRLYWNAFSPIPIHLFVDQIERAEALVADVSEHTEEIWLAIGCAVALGKPLCLISCAPEEANAGRRSRRARSSRSVRRRARRSSALTPRQCPAQPRR